MNYYNLIILFMIDLMCGADNVKYSTPGDVTNSEVFIASTTEAPENIVDNCIQLLNINHPSEPPGTENIFVNATDAKVDGPLKKKEFGKLPIPTKLPHQSTRMMMNIRENLMQELAQLNEPVSKEDVIEVDDEEQTTVNYSSVENVINTEDLRASTTEAPENIVNTWMQLLNINNFSELSVAENTLINAIEANAVGPFKKRQFGKLPIPKKLPHQRTRMMMNIKESLIKGLEQLNEPDSKEEANYEEPTTVNYSTVENITNNEVFNASMTEAPENLAKKRIQLLNINNSNEPPGAEISAIDANVVEPFKKTDFGKLPILKRLEQRTRKVVSIIGSLITAE